MDSHRTTAGRPQAVHDLGPVVRPAPGTASRALRALLGGTVLVTAAACGTTTSEGTTSGATAVHARYESRFEGGEGGGAAQLLDVVAQEDRFRMAVRDAATQEDPYQVMVWDGSTMLLLEGEAASREQDPPPDQRPPSFFVRVGDASFEARCPGGSRTGSAQVAGRAGTVYACPAGSEGDGADETSQITIDDATGLLLRTTSPSGHMTAVEVEIGVPVDAGTFATDIPADMRGPEDEVGEHGEPLPLTGVDGVPLAGGGELRLDDVRSGPSLVVIGELPGVTAMLAQVLPRTARGTAPPVYVLLNPIPFEGEGVEHDLSLATEEGTRQLLDAVSAQVAGVPVPVGIDIKGGAAGEDLRSFDELMAGTTVLAGIDETGALALRLTDDDLAVSGDELDAWIAASN
jgi:hypothetical protein